MATLKTKTINSEIVYLLDEGTKIFSGIAFKGKLTAEKLLSLPLETIKRIKNDIGFLCQNPSPTAFYAQRRHQSLSDFFRSEISRQKENGKFRTAEIYASAMRSFQKFTGNDITFSDLTPKLIKGYELHLSESDLTQNTIGFYMRALRAVFNKAVKQGLTEDNRLFDNVFTGIDTTVKRSIKITEIKKVSEYQPDNGDCLKQFARDIFVLSFLCRGMSFVDIAALKKSDIKNGILTYHRSKTGGTISIKIEPAIQKILNRNPSQNKYLLPIIKDENSNFRRQYLSTYHTVNIALKEIGKNLHISTPLTMYVARHSWASIANASNIPLAVISKGLGHRNQSITEIYLSEIDDNEVDKANKKLINLLSRE